RGPPPPPYTSVRGHRIASEGVIATVVVLRLLDRSELTSVRDRRRHQFPDIAFAVLEIGRITPFGLRSGCDDAAAGNQHALENFIHLFRVLGTVAEDKARRAGDHFLA